MVIRAKEKKERSLGVKLFLKGERCSSPKCATVRRPYPPGIHKKKKFRSGSEFGGQLLEKQRVMFAYGLNSTQMEKIFNEARKKTGEIGAAFLELLERRLDNVVFRLGLTSSRRVARQAISHGHIAVNGRKVFIPSYRVKIGDVVGIVPSSSSAGIFGDLAVRLKRQEPPAWLKLEDASGKVAALPDVSDAAFNVNQVVEYYSR